MGGLRWRAFEWGNYNNFFDSCGIGLKMEEWTLVITAQTSGFYTEYFIQPAEFHRLLTASVGHCGPLEADSPDSLLKFSAWKINIFLASVGQLKNQVETIEERLRNLLLILCDQTGKSVLLRVVVGSLRVRSLKNPRNLHHLHIWK